MRWSVRSTLSALVICLALVHCKSEDKGNTLPKVTAVLGAVVGTDAQPIAGVAVSAKGK